MTAATGTALVVVDVQNDFCAGPVATEEAVANTCLAVDAARSAGVDVVFVRFVGDPIHHGPSLRRRNALLGKRPKCLEGSWGAEFHQVKPLPGEAVFTKRACFDAFLGSGFERHLFRRRLGHLAFAGLFTDVCVDSTARTAFQKGYHITILTDCTRSLHLPDAEILRFMTLVYGARTVTGDQVAIWSRAPEEEVEWAEPEQGSKAASARPR